MTDQQLEAKFLDLAKGILPDEQAHKLIATCWGVEQLDSAADIAKAATVTG
jgi:hypothetical protein